MDWQALLYNPVYSSLGVPATLTLCGGFPINLTVLDKTAPKTISFKGVDVLDIGPAAAVRATDLADIDPADLRDAELTMNGRCWRVVSHQPSPAPTGEGQGEILLLLSDDLHG
ncbi:hypothetical protein LB553_07210 [Mesorhizobium sp. CA8]|uniref:hypothetical protein n=1 Tax=Mesorhizobium sp. CA8 TaxID=2876637 RepID=UPI001CCF06A0|nr:hypothetical protein [Mesorhizobium sp. CA8]MBZ9760666.1 hypothetical protein [Mesorhizobium sp. CA8]